MRLKTEPPNANLWLRAWLHRQLSPASYQWKCSICSVGIRGSNYHSFRTCAEPQQFEKHLKEHMNFEGDLSSTDKVCMECYRHSSCISQKEKIISCDEDFKALIQSIKDSIFPITPSSDEKQLISNSLKLSAVVIAEKLLQNEALTLLIAYEIFTANMNALLSEVKHLFSPRWLLCQLSLLLKHHLAYACILKKTWHYLISGR